ncbi:hypothetical protein CYY_009892 [Polysphondylium violaceum]|nr:hypothetical protein CYY_009892 [Polysphondylium violaceum]
MTDAQNILTQKYCKIYDINALQELEVIINSCAPNIGSLCSDKEELGTCVRISCNLIITARHVVVENLINELFLFFPKNGWSQLEYVVEESEDQDYVIIQFKPSSGILVSTYPGLSQEKYSQSLLLHTKGQTLQGSVASHIDTGQYYSFAQQGYHESNSGSSGGGYFTSNGYLIAIHRGRETGLGETYGEAISLKEIIGKNENSIIAQFINNNLSQKEEHRFSCEAIYLYPAPRKNPLLDEEGLKSKKILMKLLGDKFYTDKEIKKTKKNEISFAKPEYIENTLERYPEYNDSFNEMCYYQYGLHSKSSDYSANGFIESDHLIPYDVWCSTTNSNMRKLFKYATQQQRKGKRPGERFLPAITISYETHRKLLTTGNSEDSRAFRQKLQDLCDSGNVKDAIIACFLDYQDKKIEIPQAKALGLLSLYNKMKSEGDEQIILLSPNDITTIIQELYPKKPLRRSSAKRA